MSKAAAIARRKMSPTAEAITAEVDRSVVEGWAIDWRTSVDNMTSSGIFDEKNPEPITHYSICNRNDRGMVLAYDVPASEVAEEDIGKFYHDDVIIEIKELVAAKKAAQ